MQNWDQFIPEIMWLEDEDLRRRIRDTYEDAFEMGGWNNLKELEELPFTTKLPQTDITLREHIRGVTAMCEQVFRTFQTCYGSAYPLDHEYLIAGAILHDVGKIAEYGRNEEGRPYITKSGRLLRHCFSGAGLAMRHGIPLEIVHMIALHSTEGTGQYRSPEAVIVNRVDLLNFDPFKAFAGMNQSE